MAKFYNSNVTASVCGRPVRVYHSMTYPTIQVCPRPPGTPAECVCQGVSDVSLFQCGSSKVVYIGQIPNCKYSDGAILRLAEPFGKVAKYFVNRLRREVSRRDFLSPPLPVHREDEFSVCVLSVSLRWRKQQMQRKWPTITRRTLRSSMGSV